ncbi:hypothetical protein CAY60_009400 [Shouchella clausii]|uniref:hypothetical protein n=1 Tax=Shouchella TaxID=2893057 RepID=UPI0012E1C222|nr:MULTISPECIES: hypothetical protein [Shouchella]MCM3313758.1 hypothetical protein [Psychrobacillus sp. MER TA 17]MBU3232589.1 hypothetical protein [Shouchella clausii]MBU3265967.1 hypothetical protein [Shouchella clausii]MBU3506089.1 hypothetical protein [Shouchella clausii]MBU3536701.1 hypothetical protein [Shouchella clausii]
MNQNRKEFVNRFKERLRHLLDKEEACHLLENVVLQGTGLVLPLKRMSLTIYLHLWYH